MTIIARPPRPPRLRSVLALCALGIAAVAYFAPRRSEYFDADWTVEATHSSGVDARLLDAIRTHASEVWVETDAQVVKLLPDDKDGDAHQRFLVDVDGHSLLVAHNIDLAPRVPIAAGDALRLRARYAWNDKGGVLHWTHRDPRHPNEGGWIRRGTEVYE